MVAVFYRVWYVWCVVFSVLIGNGVVGCSCKFFVFGGLVG